MQTQTFPQIFLGGRVQVKVGDITYEVVDAIVNTANSTLLGGGGVDGAIHRRGGRAILEACKKIRSDQYPDGLPAGEAVATTAGKLAAKHVIHTVGPVWHGGGADEVATLKGCYEASLRCAEELGAVSLAFPAISTGIYHFPKERAAEIASETITEYLNKCKKLQQVFLVFFSGVDAATFLSCHKFPT